MLTLVLLAFVLMLLASIAALARVSGRNATHAIQLAQARQNARMALAVSVGRLQAAAGGDRRVTATPGADGSAPGTKHFTGAWNAETADAAPIRWLVSGNGDPLSPPAAGSVELLGLNSTGKANDVVVPLEPLAIGSPGAAGGSETTGHLAWWIADEGVKASVAIGDRGTEITYAPYEAVEARRRLSQQRPLGAAPVDATGATLIEPRDEANRSLVDHVVAFNQIAFLKTTGGAPSLNAERLRSYFHAWTPRTWAVLADSKRGGLRQDLSLKPSLLGSAFVEWANYSSYMENPAVPASPAIAPAYPAAQPLEALRRRYRMVPLQAADGIVHGVAPVLSYFLLTFNVRTDQSVTGATRPLEVRARWLVSLWNPFTSALVPENLELEISGLPAVQVVNDSTGAALPPLPLEDLYGAPFRIALPWVPAGRDDQQSWLPGRVYTWSAKEDLNKGSAVPAAGFASVFYTRNLSTAAGQGVQRAASGFALANSAPAHVQGPAARLAVRLNRISASRSRERLRTFLSPEFLAFSTTSAPINSAAYQVTYVFRLAESIDTPGAPAAWLTGNVQDFREPDLNGGCYVSGPNGPRPELYPNYTAISFPERLFDRALPASAGSSTGQSYNEDVPLFEFPRSPILSTGALQQLPLAGTRPWAIGNSWGDAGGWNSIFDRYFFSGVSADIPSPGTAKNPSLPNPMLSTIGRNPDGTGVSFDVLKAEAATGYSSKHLQQCGAFNVNSTDALAWAAVLKASRLSPDSGFAYLDAKVATGTSADAGAHLANPEAAHFYRFPFSAQETFKSAPGYAASTTEAPAAPNAPSPANTHLFRRGVRTPSNDQVVALAQAIAALVRAKLAASGPFRSVEEFLAPSSAEGGRNLFEAAIAEARGDDGRLLNDPATVPEFSSQHLTSGDLMTVLAPILFARSDSFLIRAYGDVVNPVSGVVEARAWAEARVQRMPDYVDSRQPAETPPPELSPCNQTYGRRFKVISFRWLARSDI
ncbi:MAG: hypothetical protein JWM88_3188 [Verrucomicrobia bacterium]|nr:hypothetical protein [Verrucomicrobiota bacterium]